MQFRETSPPRGYSGVRNALFGVSEDLQNLNRLSALDLSRNRLRRVPGPNWFASDESLWENLSMLRRVDLSHSEFY